MFSKRDSHPARHGQSNHATSFRAARPRAAYHDQQLRRLLEKLQTGFDALDRGEIAPLELDDLIEHYRRSARALERFCGTSGSGWERAARALVASSGQVQ